MILSILVTLSFVTFLDSDYEAVASGDDMGSGTIDDPYRGVLDVDLEDWTYPTFVEVGTVFNVFGGNYVDERAYTIQDGENVGLSMNEHGEYYITGTVDRVGIGAVTTGYACTWEGGNAIGVVIFVPAGYRATGPDFLYQYNDNGPLYVDNMDSLDGAEILSLFYMYAAYSRDPGEYTLYSGSPIYVDGCKLISSGDNSVSVIDGCIVGVLDGTEPVVMEIADKSYLQPYVTLQPYSPYETLVFESDPVTDGILIPPNHHLVTFKYENHTNPDDIVGFVIAHQVVKYGDCAAFVKWRPESEVSDSATIWCTVPTPHGHQVNAEDVWDFEQPIMSDTTLYWELESNIYDDGGEVIVPEL